MKIEHIAIWVKDLEGTKDFYSRYFEASVGPLYVNSKKRFKSYFLSFEGDGARLELMTSDAISEIATSSSFGLAHFAISVGSKEAVDQLTEQLRSDGHQIESEPRTTGDGYYESVVLDPEGNLVELTA